VYSRLHQLVSLIYAVLAQHPEQQAVYCLLWQAAACGTAASSTRFAVLYLALI
jgi:hypothetical protein